jgi:hypothetical protein
MIVLTYLRAWVLWVLMVLALTLFLVGRAIVILVCKVMGVPLRAPGGDA